MEWCLTHPAIGRCNADQSSVRVYGMHLREISSQILQIFILDMSLFMEIPNFDL